MDDGLPLARLSLRRTDELAIASTTASEPGSGSRPLTLDFETRCADDPTFLHMSADDVTFCSHYEVHTYNYNGHASEYEVLVTVHDDL
jgi:hypothetical protein